jgi:hypothetical protein
MGLVIWVYFSLLELWFRSCLDLFVELLFSILRMWLGYQGFLEVLAGHLELLFVALVFLRLLPRLEVLLFVEE